MRARSIVCGVVVGLVVAVLAACGGADSESDRQVLVVDTDLAADDLVALLYLLSTPDVEVMAVTVTGAGEVTCPRGVQVARSLAAAAGHPELRVACGSQLPSAGTRTFPVSWRAAADAAYDLPLFPVPAADDPGAVALLGDVVDEGRPVTLLTLGPLTNVAAALDAGVDLGAVVRQVVVMGGAVDVAGNVVPEGAASPLPAEWNLWVDPAAARRVVQSGLPVELVPLDATNRVILDTSVVDLLAANLDGSAPAGDLVLQLWQGNPMIGQGEASLWDPLAAVAAVRPALVPVVPATVRVEGGSGSFAGATRRDAAGAEVDLATVPDPAAVVSELVRGLAGTAPDAALVAPTTVAPVGEAAVTFDGSTCAYDGPTALPAGNLRITVTRDSVQGTTVMVGHLTAGTVEEAVAWSLAHPGETPPMVDAMGAVGAAGLPSPADVRLLPGTNGVVCAADAAGLVVGAAVTAG